MKTKKDFEYIKSSGGVDEYRLVCNGLTILLKEDHSTPTVTVMVTYHVGSRNEATGHTGATHILEHLMFKGSKNFQKKTGIWQLENFGAMINATTWLDRTNYFELLPSEHLEKAIAVEADRMRGALLKEKDLQTEMTVVRNEFEQGENEPLEALDKMIWANAFIEHPYHHSTIGFRTDIENISIERLRKFYDTFYFPNNATLTVIGDFDEKNIFKMIKKYFGKVKPSTSKIPEVYTKEPNQEGERRVIVRRSGGNKIVGIAHKQPEARNKDIYPLSLIAQIVSGGRSSRFHQKLTEKGLTVNVSTYNYPTRDPGLFVTYATLTQNTEPREVEQLILDEYVDLAIKGPSDEELDRAKNKFFADLSFSRDGSYAIAASLNEAIAVGDWTLYTKAKEALKKVTKEEVKQVARKYLLSEKSTIGYFIPK